MVEALRKNERIHLDIDTTIADALAVNMVGVNTFQNVKGLVDKMVSSYCNSGQHAYSFLCSLCRQDVFILSRSW